MTWLKWIYERIGQMFSFGVGALLIGNGTELGGDMRKIVGGVAFLAVALVLRQQMLTKTQLKQSQQNG